MSNKLPKMIFGLAQLIGLAALISLIRPVRFFLDRRARSLNATSVSWESRLLDGYWWLQIVMAREDGYLRAWEGIRIVREKVSVRR